MRRTALILLLAVASLASACMLPAERAAMHREVDQALAAGTITADEATARRRDIESGDWSDLLEQIAWSAAFAAAAYFGVQLRRGPSKPIPRTAVPAFQRDAAAKASGA